jgi:murein DD-endopeptidase MepM/ murein hydrolase activator NlpD
MRRQLAPPAATDARRGTRFLLALSLAALSAACVDREQSPPRRGADVALRAETETIESRVPRHATLDSLLRQHELSAALVAAAVESARSVFDLRQLRANRPYRLVRSFDGLLREFEYQIDGDRFLRIISRDRAQPALLDAEVGTYDKRTSVVAIRGRIDADHPSVIAAMDEAGETVQLAMSLAEIFAGQIDFESDLQQGDSFEVLFEKSEHDGQFAGYGAIQGARFVAGGREHQAFRWTDPATSKSGFYDEHGRSLKRFFLRSPLKFEPRVTSGFSRRRLHPVHRTYRPHLGVDYGARAGAAVVAVASGTVVSAGWSGGGGNMVRLRHAGGFESYYLHLSRFGNGIRRGARVEQGQVIGRVGATGTATGPHLDYRLRKNGVFVNPLIEHRKLPPGTPIPALHLASFHAAREGMVHQIAATLAADDPPRKPDAVKAAGH